MVVWDRVTRAEVVRAMKEYDWLGPEAFFAKHGFAPSTTYDLVWDMRRYPPKAILGTAYELATGERLATGTPCSGGDRPLPCARVSGSNRSTAPRWSGGATSMGTDKAA